MGATRGGITKPFSSPCTKIMAPMERVEKPHEFCHTSVLEPESSSNLMSNILAKFWPKQWEVAAWMPRPDAVTKVSHVVVYKPPANFSLSDLRPLTMGTASRSSYVDAYMSRI